MTFTAGAKLGPYEILSAIGAGGQGEVYKARDTRLNRTVAIKVLPAHFSDKAEMKARFEREAQAIAGLNHSHICVLYDVGHQDGTDYSSWSTWKGRHSRHGWRRARCRSMRRRRLPSRSRMRWTKRTDKAS